MASNRASIHWRSHVALAVVLCCSLATPSLPVALSAELTPEQSKSAHEEQQRQLQQVQRLPRRLHEQHQVEKKLQRFPQLTTLLHRLHFHYSAIEGYDRNPNLAGTRKGSGFTEQDLGMGYIHRLGSRFIYRLTGNLRYVNYYKFSNVNSFAPTLRGETAIELTPHFFIESEYDARWFWRPDDAQGNLNEQEVKVGLKHYLIPKRLYHKPSYIFQYRDFTKAEARLSDGSSGPDGRNDTTHRLDYEIGVHPVPQLLLRVHNQYGRNDSNDQFLDFYDYSFYQVTPSVTWEVSKPLLVIVGVQFQRNNYDDRAIRGMAEREDFTAFFGSLFYHVTEHASVGFHWVYSKDDSTLARTGVPRLQPLPRRPSPFLVSFPIVLPLLFISFLELWRS